MMNSSREKKKVIITMLGAGQAEVGKSFIYRGFGSKCNKCKYFNVCAKNLETGRIYRVINVRNKTFKCEAYDLELRVVEVVEAEILAAIFSKQAIEGVVLAFHRQECGEGSCENNMYCSPEGLMDNDRCEVIKVYGRISCPKGLQLAQVLLKRVPPASTLQ